MIQSCSSCWDNRPHTHMCTHKTHRLQYSREHKQLIFEENVPVSVVGRCQGLKVVTNVFCVVDRQLFTDQNSLPNYLIFCSRLQKKNLKKKSRKSFVIGSCYLKFKYILHCKSIEDSTTWSTRQVWLRKKVNTHLCLTSSFEISFMSVDLEYFVFVYLKQWSDTLANHPLNAMFAKC